MEKKKMSACADIMSCTIRAIESAAGTSLACAAVGGAFASLVHQMVQCDPELAQKFLRRTVLALELAGVEATFAIRCEKVAN